MATTGANASTVGNITVAVHFDFDISSVENDLKGKVDEVHDAVQRAFDNEFKNIKIKIGGKDADVSQLIKSLTTQIGKIQQKAQAAAQQTSVKIDPATIFDSKNQLKKNTSLSKFSAYIKQEANEIEKAYGTLKQVLAGGANLQPGTAGFQQVEKQANSLVQKIQDSANRLNAIKINNSNLFDPTQNSGALKAEEALLKVTAAAAHAQADLSKFTGGLQQVKTNSAQAASAVKVLEDGLKAAKQAQDSYNKAQQEGIGSAAKKQYTQQAEQYKALAKSQLDQYNAMLSSGTLSNLSKTDSRIVTKDLNALTKALSGVDTASNKNAKSIDSLRTKYNKLVTDIDKAIASAQKYEGSAGQNITNRLTALRTGVSKMVSQDQFDATELAGFTRVFTNQKADFGALTSEATNYVNQLEAAAGRMKQAYADIATTQTKISKTTPGTQAFTDLENHLTALQQDAVAAEQELTRLQSVVNSFYGNSMPSKTQRTVDSAFSTQSQVLSTSNNAFAGLQAAKQDMQDLADAQKAFLAAQDKLKSARALGTSHADYTKEYQSAVQQAQKLSDLLDKIQARHPNGIDMSMPGAAQIKRELGDLIVRFGSLDQQIANGKPATANLISQYESLIDVVQRYQSQLTAGEKSIVGGDVHGILKQATTQLRRGTISGDELKQLQDQFRGVQIAATSAGKESLTFGQNLKSAFQQFAGYFSVTILVMQAIQGLKQMIDYTRQLDTAMTELRKVTDVSEATYSKFLDQAANKSVQLGATLTDVVTSTGDFARLGYTIDESLQLSEAAVTLKNVGDGIDSISDASEKIISAMKGFGIPVENVSEIIDKYNEVGNNFAISSSGIASALERSASAMSSAGNSIDQSVALATGGNLVTQDPDKVGGITHIDVFAYKEHPLTTGCSFS